MAAIRYGEGPILTKLFNLRCQLLKVSEGGDQTWQRSKRSKGLPSSLWRGPRGRLGDVDSVSAGLIDPPHAVRLVPVNVRLQVLFMTTRQPLSIKVRTHLSWSFEPDWVPVELPPCVCGVPTFLPANPFETWIENIWKYLFKRNIGNLDRK